MILAFQNEQSAIEAEDLYRRKIDCPVSDTDPRIVRGVYRVGNAVTLQLKQHTAESLKALIAEIRWQLETGGVEVMPGVVFPTARDARANLAIELDRAKQIGNGYSKTFVIKGTRVPVTLDSLRAVCAAVWAHVDAAFDWEAQLLSRIEAGESLDAIAAEVIGSN